MKNMKITTTGSFQSHHLLGYGYLSTNLAIGTALRNSIWWLVGRCMSVGSGCLQFKVNYLCYL